MAALCASLGTPALAALTNKSVPLTAPPAPTVIKSKPAPVVAVPVKKVTPAPVMAVPVEKATPAPAPAMPRVLRLPSQAGKVSQVIPTKLVAKSPSWIVKGHKHYSLCSPSRHMVACAPIAPTALMKDIEVGSRIGPKGEQFLTFKIAPGTKVAPARLRYTVAHFLARTRKQVKHFNRMEVSYAPRAGQMSVRVGATANAIDDRGGGSMTCSYDDEGGYDCVGGAYESGSEGGGGGGEENYDPIPATPATNDCQFNCEYPFGNDNGDGDPCLNSAGRNICQVVVIMASVQSRKKLRQSAAGLSTRLRLNVVAAAGCQSSVENRSSCQGARRGSHKRCAMLARSSVRRGRCRIMTGAAIPQHQENRWMRCMTSAMQLPR